VATYELGRQPWGLASVAAWLRVRGADVVCMDLSREALDEVRVREADLVALHVPMHTATRLVCQLLPVVRALNERAHICVFGLYAPVNEAYLRDLGAQTILGGEYEAGLAAVTGRLSDAKSSAKSTNDNRATTKREVSEGYAKWKDFRDAREGEAADGKSASNGEASQPEKLISLERQNFLAPDRAGFLPLSEYARLRLPNGEEVLAGYTEASRGCKHLCRHCPIVPVYKGVFRVVQPQVVMADIRAQVAAGARHITFGDADFFNGPGHAIPIVRALYAEFPGVTYDATIKIEHLRKHAELLSVLRETGCLFVTSAVESIDDAVLEKLDKGHTRADFEEVLQACGEAGLALQPTFVAFHPWTTLASYCEMLEFLREHGLTESVAPIQLSIRLLIPAGSRLMELEDVLAMVGEFNREGLAYPWKHADARVDALQSEVAALVNEGDREGLGRSQIFGRIEKRAREVAGLSALPVNPLQVLSAAVSVPRLTEAWYCCAEPSLEQMEGVGKGKSCCGS
jgi:radical SAM superfamily enzyme YgiQ (UPF0313 family)